MRILQCAVSSTTVLTQRLHFGTDFVLRDSLKNKNKNRDSREPTEMIKFSKVPFFLLLLKASQLCIYSYLCVGFKGVLSCLNYTFLVLFAPLQSPLTESLIEFTDPAMNRVGADLFLCKFSPSLYSPLITLRDYFYYIWAPFHPLLKRDEDLYQILSTHGKLNFLPLKT